MNVPPEPSPTRFFLPRPSRMFGHISYVIGAVVAAAGLSMLPAAVTSCIYREWETAGWILLSAVITVLIGWFGWRVMGRSDTLTTREGFATVGLAWFAMAFFGVLPYLLTGSIDNFTNAFFETTSGFTTTGATLVPDPSELPKGILMWRSTTQWIGGMGVIILSLAILPLLGVGGVQLARAESPGPEPDRLTPRFRETARRLWYVYVLVTLVEALLLWAGDMNLFQAINHALTNVSTGGFGTEATSIAGFSPYVQWVVIVSMFIAGTSFALHFRALRDPGRYWRSAEFRLFSGVVLAAAIIILGGVWGEAPLPDNIRNSLFTALAIVTGTGYATADFGAWVPALQILVVGLMFIGGMAGSTAGGIKIYRIGILVKAASADLSRLIHPRGVFITRFGRDRVPDPLVESVQSFFLFYMFIFMTSTFLMGFLGSTFGPEMDIVTAVSASASALSNIGPALGELGPTRNYLDVTWAGKWLLSFLMIAGRLELFPVLLLFTRPLWRR
ncbi:MAG: TrkH family potassium uptake protein [bacterium]|nr:TrkH family potassium uptake protein [bacterium]